MTIALRPIQFNIPVFFLILLSFTGTSKSAPPSSTTLLYTVTPSSGSVWTGTFEIPDMDAIAMTPLNGVRANTGPMSISLITATSGGITASTVPNNFYYLPNYIYPSWSTPFVRWIDNGPWTGIQIESQSLYNMVINQNATWNSILTVGSFAVDGGVNFAENDGNFVTTTGGTIAFSVLPEPSALSLLAVGLGGFAVIRLRRS